MLIDSRPKIALTIASVLSKLAHLFVEVDSSLAEINPLVVTPGGDVIALDAKVNIDDNALYRHRHFAELREDESDEETAAREAGLSYVPLDGNIGCVVNGAGLAMATMDLIKANGGEPANFLDIGGSSSPEKVTTALKIILADPGVKTIFFNIFGGITRCDDVATGIVEALGKADVKVPIVARLTGTNEAEGKKILEKMNLTFASTMDEGVKKAVELAG
jgi:succinyl-CoA synthetase beta subunit